MEEMNRTINFKERRDEKMMYQEEKIEKLVECYQDMDISECVEAHIQEAYRKIYEGLSDKE